MLGHREVWDSCLRIIRDNISEESYKAFFEKVTPLRLEGSMLTLQSPSQFICDYIEEHYIDLLRKTLRRELGPDAKLQYSIVVAGEATRPVLSDSEPIPRNKPVPLSATGSSSARIKGFNPFVMPGLPNLEIDPQLNPKYAFENYIEGACNKLARNAGLSIAQNPGTTSFNPLFINGSTGLGKTHLAQAIGLEVKKLHPDKVVLYVNANKFKEQYTSAVQKNETNNFLHFYQMVDVLILDDVHDFAGQTKTQDTFFLIFDQLHRSKKQIILTSDKSPVEIEGLEPRILSRFKWGLVAELTTPDYDTRLAIYRHKVRKDGIDIDDGIIDYLADKVSSNVREFEGVLNRLLAEATFNKKAISMEMVVNVVNKNIKNTQREFTVDSIYKTVCDYFRIPSDNAQSKTRKREIVQARQIAMYFSKCMTKTSLASIGAQIGGKNHATVVHACKTINNLMETDRNFFEMVSNIEKKLRSN
ncbi:MAG: chromosomal replication initiator protein DnaA [Prevotellaceae bacterium]|jgi:chromosomal replication initiator protein|nr:chromosomal replication initiator protein DnaA [Prevotellaceae bacterium]